MFKCDLMGFSKFIELFGWPILKSCQISWDKIKKGIFIHTTKNIIFYLVNTPNLLITCLNTLNHWIEHKYPLSWHLLSVSTHYHFCYWEKSMSLLLSHLEAILSSIMSPRHSHQRKKAPQQSSLEKSPNLSSPKEFLVAFMVETFTCLITWSQKVYDSSKSLEWYANVLYNPKFLWKIQWMLLFRT